MSSVEKKEFVEVSENMDASENKNKTTLTEKIKNKFNELSDKIIDKEALKQFKSSNPKNFVFTVKYDEDSQQILENRIVYGKTQVIVNDDLNSQNKDKLAQKDFVGINDKVDREELLNEKKEYKKEMIDESDLKNESKQIYEKMFAKIEERNNNEKSKEYDLNVPNNLHEKLVTVNQPKSA